MIIKIPGVVDEMPSLETLSLKYKGLKLKIIFKTTSRVYWRTKMSEQQNHRCCYCGVRTTELSGKSYSATLEHIIPTSCGGSDDPENYAMACNKCNSKRGNQSWEIFIEIRNKSVEVKNIAISELMSKRQEYEECGLKLTQKNKKGTGMARKKDQLAAINAVKSGIPNPFTLDSRPWRIYERYLTSEKFADVQNGILI